MNINKLISSKEMLYNIEPNLLNSIILYELEKLTISSNFEAGVYIFMTSKKRVIKLYNHHHQNQYALCELQTMNNAVEILAWYIGEYIPNQLKQKGLPSNIENILILYELSIYNLVSGQIPLKVQYLISKVKQNLQKKEQNKLCLRISDLSGEIIFWMKYYFPYTTSKTINKIMEVFAHKIKDIAEDDFQVHNGFITLNNSELPAFIESVMEQSEQIFDWQFNSLDESFNPKNYSKYHQKQLQLTFISNRREERCDLGELTQRIKDQIINKFDLKNYQRIIA
ncbi:hypothetical protein [Aureibacter tunicatorum]|uniref:Uncharacterized protein n=1 Tax=Aureibacter tunicatorum TaxID=866807 RepID=A0AAE3XSK4_9BACT|nr:hypothetical protein [Aureibacter tunicatorum]MDR6240784.1 hypothetical protein [Aureibacter tunicatorum]